MIRTGKAGDASGDGSATAAACRMATVVSARSGDTEQSWLTDLAVGAGGGQIKVGSLTGSERTAKWNRLLQLEATRDLPFARTNGIAPGPAIHGDLSD